MKLAPLESERQFVTRMNHPLIQKILWPLLSLFVLLGFLDIFTTFVAMSVSPAFVELNPFAASMFRLRFGGVLLASAFKFLPLLPLSYMVSIRERTDDDFEVRLLKLTALAVLVAVDIYNGAIVFGNNLPMLVGILS